MTAQTMEKLILNGEEVRMASDPLTPYLDSLDEKPNFYSIHTGCWRGYVGTWEIKDEKLFFIDIDGFAEIEPKTYGKVDINFLFPNQKIVFADWFSGEIRVPKGNRVKYAHMGYESTYESDLFLTFKDGQLVGQKTVDNYAEETKRITNKAKNPAANGELESSRKTLFSRIRETFKKKHNSK